MDKRTRRPGLAAYLTLAFAALAGLLTLLLVAVIGISAGNQMRDDIRANLAELAHQTADKLDRGMFERYREVRLIAHRYDLTDHAGTRQFLAEIQSSYPYYAWIGVTDARGVVTASTDGVLEGVDVSARPWFSNVRKGLHVGDVHEAMLLAHLLAHPSEEPLRFVDIAFGCRDGGVLAAHLSWQWARDLARSIVDPRGGQRDLQAFIVGADGRVLLGPPGLEGKLLSTASARASGSGALVETWPDGHRYLVGYARSEGHADYPGLGWNVLVRQDSDSAFLPVESVQRRVLVSGIVIGLVFSLFGVLLARLISRPLQALSEAAERVGNGQAGAMPAFANSPREVRTLAGSLGALVHKLLQKEAVVTELNQDLERRVERRTAELAAALEQVKTSEARIHAILESSHDAFVAMDLNGRIVDWNSSAARMFGLSRGEVLGQDAAALIMPERLRERFAQRLAKVDPADANTTAGRIELIFCDRAGREFPAETSVSLTGSGEHAFFSAFLRDISERKQVERMKNEFISTVSHELRTPLTAIRFSLNMLADGLMGEFEPDVQKLLNIANDSCERLVRLINDMLDVEKIEAGRMAYHFKPHSLLALAQDALEATRAYAAPFEVELALESDGSDPHAAVDADRITQVLVNLLSNAVKFSRAGTCVQLRVASAGGMARISVTDHGEGVPPEFQPHMFEKFAQADGSNTRTRSGTGLGLSICKQLVTAHQGRIGFTSRMGEGSTFEVELPLA